MTDDRLPWFPCYPTKLLGALAQMSSSEKLVYVVMLLRIYESGGACKDSIEAIARRVGYNKRVVLEALNSLFKAGRLHRQEDGIHNPVADKVVEKTTAFRAERSSAGQKGAERRWKKDQSNQMRGDGKANAQAMAKDGYLHLELDLEGKKERAESKEVRVPRPKRARDRSTLPDGWSPSEKDFQFATAKGFGSLAIGQMAEAFGNHHRALGNLMADWAAAWRTWVSNEIKFNGRKNGDGGLRGTGRSLGEAIERRAGQIERGEVRIPPRPTLLPRPGEADVRLLPKG